MAAKNNTPIYDAPNRWLIAAPAFVAAASVALIVFGNFVPLGVILLLLMLVIVTVMYVKEAKYLVRVNQKGRARFQVFSALAIVLAPFLAILAGDIIGAHEYGTPMDGFGDSVGLIIGGILAAVWVYGCVVANEVHVRSKEPSTVLKVLSTVFTVIAYLIVAGVSWIAYGVTYSLHDPSTE